MDANFVAELDHDEMLVAELHHLDVQHLVRLRPETAYPPLPPAELIAGLANHPRARFRGALILLFLRRPALSVIVPTALEALAGLAADTLRLYYQAAAYLRPELEGVLKRYSDDLSPLPDRFSTEFGLPAAGSVLAEAALAVLGEVHTRLSGRAYNWARSYRQHLTLFLRQLKRGAPADITAGAFTGACAQVQSQVNVPTPTIP